MKMTVTQKNQQKEIREILRMCKSKLKEELKKPSSELDTRAIDGLTKLVSCTRNLMDAIYKSYDIMTIAEEKKMNIEKMKIEVLLLKNKEFELVEEEE